MPTESPKTTQEALKELNDAIKKLGDAIEYEIHIMRLLETSVAKLAKLLKESK